MAAADPYAALLADLADFWDDDVERSPAEAEAVARERIALMHEEIDRLEDEIRNMLEARHGR